VHSVIVAYLLTDRTLGAGGNSFYALPKNEQRWQQQCFHDITSVSFPEFNTELLEDVQDNTVLFTNTIFELKSISPLSMVFVMLLQRYKMRSRLIFVTMKLVLPDGDLNFAERQ
jgi:hypothetical protein